MCVITYTNQKFNLDYIEFLIGEFVLVIAWVAVKFGINTTLVVLEMVNFTRRMGSETGMVLGYIHC